MPSHGIQRRQRITNGRLQPPSRRLQLKSDVFSLATHPTERLVAVGESSGRVGMWSWPEEEEDGDENEDEDEDSEGDSEDDSEEEVDEVRGKNKKVKNANEVGMDDDEYNDEEWWEEKWSVKRHKGSTRCVRFSCDGEVLFSTGTDSLLKVANTTTGQVLSKSWLPGTTGSGSTPTHLGSPATALLPLNPQHILIGTDDAKVHLLDLRTSIPTTSAQFTPSTLPSSIISTWNPSTSAPIDYISSLTSLPPGAQSTSGYSYHFIATGGGYLFHMDSRRPGKILHTSEDQNDEILSSVIVDDWISGTKKPRNNETATTEGGKILTGFNSGIIGIWNRGGEEPYQGHYERINVNKSLATPIHHHSSKRKKTSTLSSINSPGAGGESIDCIALLPATYQPLINALDSIQRKRQSGFFGRYIATGTGEGKVKVIRTGGNPGLVGVYEHFPMSEKEKERMNRRRRELEARRRAGVGGVEGVVGVVGVDNEGKDGDDYDEIDEPKEAVLALEVSSEGRIVSGGGSFITMFFEHEEEDNDGESDSDSDNIGVSDSDKDSDDDNGWDSDSSNDGKKRKREKRKKKKNSNANGRPEPRPNVIGSFAGLD